MTRLEQAREREAKAAQDLEKARATTAKEEGKQRLKDRKANDKKRYHVGALADEAGLFVLDAPTLGSLFTLLAPLASIPDPVGALEGVLADPLVFALTEDNDAPEDDSGDF